MKAARRFDPSNQPLLDALSAGDPLTGHVLVRSDGRVVPVEQARVDDWRDLQAQHDVVTLVESRAFDDS